MADDDKKKPDSNDDDFIEVSKARPDQDSGTGRGQFEGFKREIPESHTPEPTEKESESDDE